MSTPTPSFYLNFIYHAQRLDDRLKAVRHHPRILPLQPLLLSTSSHKLPFFAQINETKSSFYPNSSVAFCCSCPLQSQKQQTRLPFLGGGSTGFSAGCLGHVKHVKHRQKYVWELCVWKMACGLILSISKETFFLRGVGEESIITYVISKSL